MSSKHGGRGGGGASKGKKPAKAGAAEEKREDALQAVILADSFQDRFRPFTLETPRCLLPVANTPIIEYTLEYLASAGVQEVFIYCGAHSEKIETYIHDSARWNPSSILCPFTSLEFIRVSDANSIGDFLRDLDKRGLIGGDFLLVHGDLVANIPLDDALARHRARREANRDACMTMILRSAGVEEHRAKRARGITPTFVIDPTSGRCLQYEEVHPLQSDHYLELDPAILEMPEFEIRSDLVDCGIDICTPDVLALWSESFDYELPRKNFLHGVLKDWELNGKLIHTEIIEDRCYAARASNLQMYNCLSQDILGGWTFPYVPENNFLHGQTYKRVTDGACSGSCFEEGVLVAKKSKVSKSVLGRGTEVGSGTVVSKSIIGRNCRIGKNVRIENSYIWDDVTIEDGSSVTRSILASGAVIGKDCQIPPGSLISYGVQLGEGTQLPAKPVPVISLLTHDGEPAKTDVSLVGEKGQGAFYEEAVDEDGEDADETDPSVLQKSLLYSLDGLNLSSSSISTLASHDSVDSDDMDSQITSLQGAGDVTPVRSRLSSFASDDGAAAAIKSDAFHGDAVHGLLDALRADDNGDFDSAKLEFMGLRLANNASDSSMRRAIAVAFARRAAELLTPEHGGLEPTKAAEQAFSSKKGAVKFIKEVGVGAEKADNQAEFALALQKALLGVKSLENARAGALLAAMLQKLYNLDVLEEDGIIAWWEDKRASGSDSMDKIKEKCRVLVEWLENADEEDSEEESEEDDE